MSRVSDAIRRAAEGREQAVSESAKQRLAQTPANTDIGLKVESQLASGADDTEQIDKANGANASKRPNGRAQPTVSEIPERPIRRSWIARALFGRARRKVESYPLIALEKNSHAGEQYKILREQIVKIAAGDARRFIAVTSPIKGDGKTTVAANLAAAMALHHEQQVLLVDADLRSPTMHRYFGIHSAPGLADYLSSTEDDDWMDYVQDTSIPGLRLLTAGKGASHSAELLASERMKALVKEIAEKFSTDQVIVDTSPVLSTSDPLVLSRQLDGLLMVVRAGRTPRDCLSEAIKLVGAEKIMGLVLNGAELGWVSKYYYYYY